MNPLYERYRPKTFEQVLGQDKAVDKIKRALSNGWGGQAFWISGSSGTGKTTLARIIASLGAADMFIEEYDTADDIGIEQIERIAMTMHYYGGAKGGRAYIINEAHGLRKLIVRKLLGILERIPKHVVFIFTTTKEGQLVFFDDDNIDASPLLSRCIQINLTNQRLADVFGKHCKDIADKEQLNGKPIESYIRLAKDCKNNCRMMLQAIEAGSMLKD